MLRAALRRCSCRPTEGLYQRIMDKVSRERKLGVPRTELEYADLPYLVRAPEIRPHLRERQAAAHASSAPSRASASTLDAQPNVHVDTEVRELKSPRAFCSPVRVPDEIYLVRHAQGRPGRLRRRCSTRRGHTEHFAHSSPDLPFEYRFLGDNAVTEGFAFIFDHLIAQPRAGSRRYLDYADSTSTCASPTSVELYFMRRYAAKLAYETELHVQTGPLDAMAARYSALLSAAVQIDVPRGQLPGRHRRRLLRANYLRAWMLEGALRMHAAGQLRHGVVPRPRGRGLAQGAVVDGQHLLGRPAAAQERRRPARHADPLEHHFERALGR